MKHTAGAAARGGGDAPPSLGLVPSAAAPPPSSSPSDSLPRFAAIAAHNTTPPSFSCFCLVIVLRFVCAAQASPCLYASYSSGQGFGHCQVGPTCQNHLVGRPAIRAQPSRRVTVLLLSVGISGLQVTTSTSYRSRIECTQISG